MTRPLPTGMKQAIRAAAGALACLLASPGMAVCGGASLDQEYREADVVVRALVVAETRVTDDEPSAAWVARWGHYSPVLVNRLRVTEVFKGAPGPAIQFFQEVSSGRFDVDIGEEYLLFFHHIRPHRGIGSEARGAMHVRYACGQSKRWSEVRGQDVEQLRLLARRR